MFVKDPSGYATNVTLRPVSVDLKSLYLDHSKPISIVCMHIWRFISHKTCSKLVDT